MAMTAALQELHRIHRQLSDLRERLARGPKQVKARQTHVEALQRQLSQRREEGKNSRVAADKKQLDLKTSENKIVDLRTKLNACSSNKEYQALLDQIAAAEMANSVLADEILEALEVIDSLDSTASESERELDTAGTELEKLRQEVAATAESIQADLDRLEGELKTVEKSLPAEVKADYDRVVRSKGEDALAAVEGETCGGCYQQITPNMQNDLALGRPVFCRSCGRLLYRAEGTD